MSWPQVVFFDLDDTLVDHRAAATAALTSWLAGLSAPIGAAATGISADAHSDADAVRLWFEL